MLFQKRLQAVNVSGPLVSSHSGPSLNLSGSLVSSSSGQCATGPLVDISGPPMSSPSTLNVLVLWRAVPLVLNN